MYDVNSNIENLSESDGIIRGAMIKILEKAWEGIPKNYIIGLVESIDDSVNAVWDHYEKL